MECYRSPITGRTHVHVPELGAWKVELTQGKYTLVDLDVFEEIKDQNWIAHKTTPHTYARKRALPGSGKCHLSLHREVAGAQPKDQVDHINLDTLDNRRCNLRVATRSLNKANGEKYQRKGGSTSKYKGVTWRSDNSKWRAQIRAGGRHISLGQYENETDAARAYNKAAKEFFGEFARVNNL